MTVKSFLTSFAFAAGLFGGLLLLNGCGKAQAPEPPLTNSRLLLQILAALQEKSHDTAYNQISRLLEAKKSDVFLTILQNNELCNIYLEKAQRQLDQGQFKEAGKTIQDAMLTYGRNPTFLAAQRDIETLSKIQALMPAVDHPANGSQLEKNTTQILKLLDTLPDANGYRAGFQRLQQQARVTQLRENDRALFSLYSEIVRLRAAGDEKLANLLTSEFYSANPPPGMIQTAVRLQEDANGKKEP